LAADLGDVGITTLFAMVWLALPALLSRDGSAPAVVSQSQFRLTVMGR